MKLIDLWTERKYWMIVRPRQRAVNWIAHHLPRELVMRCYYRVIAHATTGKHSNTVIPELTAMEAISRWEEPN